MEGNCVDRRDLKNWKQKMLIILHFLLANEKIMCDIQVHFASYFLANCWYCSSNLRSTLIYLIFYEAAIASRLIGFTMSV